MKSTDPFRALFAVESLGAIERAEMTIRPLTLFFGPNGTNKTWAAYALYGLLKRYRSGFMWPNDVGDELIAQGDAALAELHHQANARQPSHRKTVFRLPRPESTAQLSGVELAEILALKAGDLGAARAVLDCPLALPLPELIEVEVEVEVEVEPTTSSQWSYHYDRVQDRALVTVSPDVESSQHLLSLILGDLLSLGGSAIAFPAERKALLALHQQISTLSVFGRTRGGLDSGPGRRLGASLVSERLQAAAASLEASLPQPSMDFVRYIDARWHINPDFSGTGATHLAEALESILGGRLDFERVQARVGRSPHLRFRTGGMELPIHSAHSLARSLGGLDLYLRDSAEAGDFVFIDEPEMNAHPETQVAIAEFIALMVNAGLRVVATTHSPYIIDHLHNLIEAERLNPEAQTRFAERFKLKTSDAFISGDQVAAYHFGRDGVVSDAFDRADRVIDWSLLGDDADDIANLYSELLGAQSDD